MTTATLERVGVHPLDPLSEDEISRASEIAAAHLGIGETLRFPLVAGLEPVKGSGDERRRAELITLDTATGSATEVVVDLEAGVVETATPRPDVQAFPLMEEFGRAEAAIRADEGWRAAMRGRGVSEAEIDGCQIDPWPGGNFGSEWEMGHRILKGIAYLRDEPEDNGYGRPVEGLVAIVDLVENRVLEIIDEPGGPTPKTALRFDHDHGGAPREDVKPLDIVQPEGPSFTLEGHLLRWQKWQMRASLHPREGLVLHEIGYWDDAGTDPLAGPGHSPNGTKPEARLRPICHRASLAEMVVPYGDPGASQYFKNAFDSGEVGGLGRLTNSLELGCDCLGEIAYMDGAVTDERGGARTIRNAICIHEEDFGILWKHTYRNPETGAPESWVRRSRRLVVSAIATVGNYDYGFYWYFYQDGSWEMEIKATGIIQTAAIADDDPQITRHKVAPNLAGAIHQHFFSFRLDMAVDGGANTVYEVDAVPLPRGPENPRGNAFTSRAVPIPSEAESGRMVHSPSARHWRVSNDGTANPLGNPPAYALVPGETVDMMAAEDSAVGQRAQFARKQLWVTAYDPSERYPAGDYPNQSRGGEGMPKWVARNRPLTDADVVLWYTVGMNHVATPEDWPVAPVHRAGFSMKPWGFFDRNPGLDVPMPEHCAHEEGGHEEGRHGDASRNGHG